MFVTASTLVGTTLINGSIVLQIALLPACIYNVLMYPDVENDLYLKILLPKNRQAVRRLREYILPGCHFLLIIINGISSSHRLQSLKAIKQTASFLGLLLQIFLLLAVS